MNIGIVVPGFSADERDWCIPAHLDLVRWLAAGNQVQVFALRYPHRRDVYKVYGSEVHSFNGEGSRGLASARLWGTVLGALARKHYEAPFDVLHAIYGGEAGLVTVLAGLRLGVPSLISLLGGELVGMADIGYGQDLRRRQRLMNEVALRFGDRLLGGSQAMTKLARARVSPTRRERIQTLPLGVDTRMFSPVRSTARSTDGGGQGFINILNVGSLIEVKDQATLLAASAELMRETPNARLCIVGTGKLESDLRTLASNLGIANRVDFVGAVAHDHLSEFYRRADLFVQSSRHEGEGMAVLEAGASGTAVVGTEVGVLADLAARGAAIAVPPNNPGALAGAMRRALASRAAWGMRAYEFVQREYNLDKIGEQLIELYCSVSRVAGARRFTQPIPHA